MPLDPTIALQGRLPQIQGPLELATQAAQYRGLMNANQMDQMKFDQYQQGLEEDRRLKGLLSGGIPQADLSQRLIQGGFLKQGLETGKTLAETAKSQGEADKTRLANGLARFDAMERVMQGVTDQASYDAARQQAVQMFGPDVASQMNPVYDPGAIAQAKAKAMSIKDRLEQEWKQKGYDLDVNKEQRQAVNQPFRIENGKMVPNLPFQQYETTKAKAGATSISMNTGQKGLDNELKLRGDFRSEPIYKAHNEVQSAYNQITAALKLASPAGDLAAATKVMKILDPTSVVRESELGMAMAATGLLDRLMNLAQLKLSGEKLTPNQREDFKKLSDSLFAESQKAYDAKASEYEGIANDYGLNKERVVGKRAKTPETSAGWSIQKVD